MASIGPGTKNVCRLEPYTVSGGLYIAKKYTGFGSGRLWLTNCMNAVHSPQYRTGASFTLNSNRKSGSRMTFRIRILNQLWAEKQ